MAAGPRPLLWCVVTSLVFGACLCDEEYPVCAIPCCTVAPSCSRALHVTCQCPDMDTIALKKGDMPASVQVVHILHTKNVIIHNDAISDLQSLTNFSLRGIDNVEIEQGGMALQKQSKLRLVRIQDIETLRIRSKAFSGVWEQKTNVWLSGITRLNIESNAFDYVSMSLGPGLMLQNVGMLALASKGFNAPVAQMSLDNVVMEACHGESFGGHIQTTEFNNVTIVEAKARCVSGFSGLTSFSIKSSRMEVVHPQAFSGKLYELIIKNSSFVTMHERSLHLRVTNMEISRSFVKHLSSNGLSVRADDSIRLEKIRVEFLRKSALAGLQIEPSQTGFYQPLRIRQLEIMEAELGSLTFPECTDLQITDLDLVAPWPRICPTERWTRALSEGTASGPLSPAQYELFFQLYERSLCDEDDRLPFPIATARPHCGAATDSLRGHRHGDASNEDSTKLRSGEEAVVEYLVDYKVVGNDVPSREARKVDADDTSDEALAAASTHNSSVQPPPVNKEPLPMKPRSAVGDDPGRTGADQSTSGPADDLPATGGPGPAPGGVTSSEHQHRLLLYLSLGVVISLAAVLAVALLLLLLVRRRSRGQPPADDQPPPVETLLMVMANRLMQQDGNGDGNGNGGGNGGGNGEGRLRTVSNSLGFSSARPSVDLHQYEPIREDLLLPLPIAPALREPAQLIYFDESSVSSSEDIHSSGIYDNLMER